MRKILFSIISICIWIVSCQEPIPYNEEGATNADFLHRSMKQLTDVIVHDIFSPPQASRIYAYPSIAAYEIMVQADPKLQSLAGQLHGFSAVPTPEAGKEYLFPLASTHAFLTVGRKLIFSEDSISQFMEKIHEEYRQLGVPKAVFNNSVAYGDAVAQHIIEWIDGDNYKQTRTFPKFTINQDDPARWQPTPPDYMAGIEPHWRSIRTFVIDSASQFTPEPPTPYNMTDKNSQFYKETVEVYEIGKNLTPEQKAIADFWDCNPYATTHTGHAMYATKKITPGGHWVNIAALAAKKAKADYAKTVETYTLTTISLADAFISCWDEKYRSNLVRPETVINEFIDDRWLPGLQTPPFPEYTSGHSVISAAASVALTHIYGDNFQFDDTSEMEYGLPMRSFDSFYAASEEAAISRLYGGIHYRPACEVGVTQGRALGKFIAGKVKTRQ